MVGTEKIKVMIVDDIAETRENIRKLLQFENDVEVVGIGRTGREAIDLAKEIKPDVILMDINMPDMDGIQATELIRKGLPFVQIIILSVQNDANYMRRAMQAGASDFLAKPPTLDELVSSLRRAGNMSRLERDKVTQVEAAVQAAASMPGGFGMGGPGREGKVITVYSPKGGTGCTTLATNLAVALQSEETPVCLVDANLQFGDVAIFLNEQVKFSVADLAPRVGEIDSELVENVLLKHALSGIKVLAAPHRPEYADNVTGDQFAKTLNALRRYFTFIIVDTASTLTEVILDTLSVTDLLVLVVNQDIPSIKNVRLFLDLAAALEIDRKSIVLVMNRFDKRIGITPEKVGDNFKQEVVGVIPVEPVVINTVNRGIPMLTQRELRSLPMAKAIMDLASVLQQRLSSEAEKGSETKKTQSGSFLKR
jgi:pilus assembly protein CpaE